MKLKRTSEIIRKKQKIDDIDVEFIYKITNTKNSYIRLNHKNEIVVTVSRYSTPKQMGEFISHNIAKFVKRIETNNLNKKYDRDFNYIHSAGEKLDVLWNIGKKNKFIKQENNKIVFEIKNEKLKEKVVLDWLLKENISTFNFIYDEYCSIIKASLPMKFKKMTSKWGYYSLNKKNVVFTTYLLMFEKECWNYVIVHELCHHFIKNHSKDFWKLVESYYPEFKKAKNILNLKI